jgi:hypothetical protein
MFSRHLATLVCLLALTACGGAARAADGSTPSGVVATAPASAVEQFLGFAREQRFTEMGHIFGTSRGPLAQQQASTRVNLRMQAIASMLRHD